MFLFASLLLSTVVAITPLTESAALDSPYRHVRSQDRSVRHLLKRGFKYSYTFRQLMARLEQSDVIVYVEDTPNLPASLDGRMMMLPTVHGYRYVRIQLALRAFSSRCAARRMNRSPRWDTSCSMRWKWPRPPVCATRRR
jgi:hypothetical protein